MEKKVASMDFFITLHRLFVDFSPFKEPMRSHLRRYMQSEDPLIVDEAVRGPQVLHEVVEPIETRRISFLVTRRR